MRYAIGVTTYNRPEFAERCMKSIRRYLGNDERCAGVFVHDDGSDPRHHGSYLRAMKAMPDAHWTRSAENVGVAVAKNRLLDRMLATDADWLILCEDDIKVLVPEAVDGYVKACKDSGLHHLSFAHHGPMNAEGPVDKDPSLEYYFHAIGAWCIYSRQCLNEVGLFDENFVNAWEHVEHSLRLAMLGYTTGPYRWADAVGSQWWLAEQPRSLEKSVIRSSPQWHAGMVRGLQYWRDERPESFDLMFGPMSPMHEFAMGMLA